MQDHIDEFTRLQVDVDYHRPPGVDKMRNETVNLAFFRSVGKPFQTFQQAMGERVCSISTAEVFATVKALVESQEAEEDNLMQGVKALVSRSESGPQRVRDGNESTNHQYQPYSRKRRCHYCKSRGHHISECFKKRWKEERWVAESDTDGEEYRTYESGMVARTCVG